jgi:hypothetical protein
VALVQALLGLKRAKGGKMYLSGGNHVTGKLDRDTAVALMQFRLDHGDKNVKGPLARSGPVFNRLAQGQALAVLEGTATPYKLATLAEPGEAKGEAAKLLSAERKVELKAVMKDFISDWGIALDVEIKVAANNLPARSSETLEDYNSLPLVAQFTSRNLSVHNGRALSSVSNNTQFQARSKVLYEAVGADIKARCVAAFGISDPVDVKIQNGLKDPLASVVRTDLEGVEALAQFYLADWRKKGFTLAVRFLETYLKADAGEISLSQDEALSFPDVRNAVRLNITRFWQINLIAPKTDQQGFQKMNAISKDREKNELQFTDHWVSPVSSKAMEVWLSRKFDAGLDPQTGSIGYGTGGSNLKSTGVFDLRRRGNRIAVTVFVTHEWSDDGYDFNKGAVFHDESQVLERHKKAKTFPWKATWEDVLKWDVEIIDPFTDNATRRMIGFDTMPPDEDIAP